MGGDSTTARAAVGLELLGRTLEECGNGVVIAELAPQGPVVVWANREFERLTGRSAKDLGGRPLDAIFEPEPGQPGVAAAIAGLPAGEDHRLVVRMPRAGGGWFWDQVHLAPVRGGLGRFTHGIVVHTDISERVEAEERLRRARDQALQRLEDFPALIWRSEPGGSRFHFNRLWCEFTGRALEQEIDGGWESSIHPDDLERVRACWRQAHGERTCVSVEYRLRHHQDGWRWVLERGSPVTDLDGTYAGFLGSCSDLSELKRAEEEARCSHARLSTLIGSLATAVIALDADGRVVRWNLAAERILGIPSEVAVGRELRSIDLGLDWTAVDTACAGVAPGESAALDDLHFTRPDGTRGTMALRIAQVPEPAPGWVWSASDVTERRAQESRLVQDQKLQSIGQLAAGIAHEINTPMQFVGDNTRFLSDAFNDLAGLLGELREVLADPAVALPRGLAERIAEAERKADSAFLLEEVPKAITQSLDGINRVTRIVKAMKEFSHPGAEEPTPIDLNHAIESTTTVSRNEWKYVADLVLDLDPALRPVPVLPGGFNQVVLNLVVNAAHAIGDVVRGNGGKGTIAISTRDEGDRVVIRISDTGTGIPAGIRNRIFDPFFTTKEVGRGTGQGLAIVRTEIVEKLGGAVDFATEDGRGTTFIITIPRHQATVQVRRDGAGS